MGFWERLCFVFFILYCGLFLKKKCRCIDTSMKFPIIMTHTQKKQSSSFPDLFVFIFLTLMRPTSAKRFLRLQASLPTSKIKSLAKGIVEVEGTLIMKEPLSSPVDHEICIGYYYTIEDIDRDSDGKLSYRTIHRETRCNPFSIKDETGTIDIEPEGIELVLLGETNVSSSNNKRYTETLLKDGQKCCWLGTQMLKTVCLSSEKMTIIKSSE